MTRGSPQPSPIGRARRGLFVLLCVVLVACGTTKTSSPPSLAAVQPSATPPTPAITPTIGPTATPVAATPTPRAFAPTDWGRVGSPAFTDRYGTLQMLSVATSGDTVVAVGLGPRGAAAWSMGPDGIWRRAPDIPSFQGSEMRDVVASPPGFVAVGQHGDQAAAWTSVDGTSWNLASVEPAGATPDSDDGSFMARVTAGPRGLIAVGPGAHSDIGPAEWSSPDGLDWAVVVDPIPAIGTAEDIGLMPDGSFVIVGAPPVDGGSTDEAWRSTDGLTWTALPGLRDTWVHAVAPWKGGIVVVGNVSDLDAGTQSPAVWVMASDGTWERTKDVPGATAERDVDMTAVSATADRLIVTGPGPAGDIGVWISDDARSWTLIDSPGLKGPEGEFEPRDIAIDGSGVVVVGEFPNHDSSSTWSASVWTDPAPSQPAGATPVLVAHPCPTATSTLVDVAEMTPDERLACYGGHDLTLRGYLGQYGDSGLNGDPPTPRWLADDTSCCRPFLPLAGRPQDVIYLPVAFDPTRQRGLNLADGTPIQVTGHFDDSRARTCRGGGESAKAAIASCRRQFVVMSYTRIDQP